MEGVIGISGCTSSDAGSENTTTQPITTQSSNQYTVGTSTFQIPVGWRQVNDPRYTDTKKGFDYDKEMA